MHIKKISDYAYHPPCGSNVPGRGEDPNPYVYYTPEDIREMIPKEKDIEERNKMISALKQWERIYTYPGYPYRRGIHVARLFLKKAEYQHPSINIPYYQDSETPQGLNEIIDSLYGLADNEDNVRLDYNRQGERPFIDSPSNIGDFTSPKEPAMGDVVKDKGDGPDPEGMEIPEPATGGDMDLL